MKVEVYVSVYKLQCRGGQGTVICHKSVKWLQSCYDSIYLTPHPSWQPSLRALLEGVVLNYSQFHSRFQPCCDICRHIILNHGYGCGLLFLISTTKWPSRQVFMRLKPVGGSITGNKEDWTVYISQLQPSVFSFCSTEKPYNSILKLGVHIRMMLSWRSVKQPVHKIMWKCEP